MISAIRENEVGGQLLKVRLWGGVGGYPTAPFLKISTGVQDPNQSNQSTDVCSVTPALPPTDSLLQILFVHFD